MDWLTGATPEVWCPEMLNQTQWAALEYASNAIAVFRLHFYWQRWRSRRYTVVWSALDHALTHNRDRGILPLIDVGVCVKSTGVVKVKLEITTRQMRRCGFTNLVQLFIWGQDTMHTYIHACIFRYILKYIYMYIRNWMHWRVIHGRTNERWE